MTNEGYLYLTNIFDKGVGFNRYLVSSLMRKSNTNIIVLSADKTANFILQMIFLTQSLSLVYKSFAFATLP